MGTRGRAAVLAGVCVAVWFTAIIADHGWNPSTLLAAGRDDTPVAGYITQNLGPNFIPQEAWGHDGKFVFIRAHDPFLLNPGDRAALLDAPVYRSQRVLVPALVGTGAIFGPWGVVWAFPVVMILAVMVGAWATAGLAEYFGRSAWWGVAFLVNPGLFYSYRRGNVDVVAVALLILGVHFVSRRQFRRAGLILVGAVLAKEVMILGAVGLTIYSWREGRRALPVVLWPLVAGVGWGLYVRLRLGAPVSSVGADTVTAPFRGVWRVIGRGLGPDAVVAVVILGLVVVALVQAWRRPSPVAAAAVGFALLLPLLPEAVWGGYVDAWRTAAPIMALQIAAARVVVPRSRPAMGWRVTGGPKRETGPSAA